MHLPRTALPALILFGLTGCPEAATPDAGSSPDAYILLSDAGPSDAFAHDAPARDAGSGDAGMSGDAGRDAGPPPPSGPVLYPFGERHSPMPLDVADTLRMRAAASPAQDDDVFAKVGDSITVSTSFMNCFVSGPLDLAGRTSLMPTINHFRGGSAGSTDPFRRVSLAAGVGWSASRALMGTPSPLTNELGALTPRFATLMYGTNDIGFTDIDVFGRNMTRIADQMLAGGTIPVMSSIPPRDDSAMIDARVPLYNALLRAIAQSRQVPFVDYHRELLSLPDHGLSTADGIHPQASMGGCVFTAAGLRAGANVRNLIVIEALDRLRRVLVLGEDSLDASAPRLMGEGTRAAPYIVSSLPFAAHGDTRTGGESAVARWDACSMANEGGRELRFRFRLASARRVTAAVSSGTGADIDVHVIRAGGGPAECIARDNRQVDVDLAAGEYELVADTFTNATGPLAGEVFVMIL
jgi:hypothetical protein